MNLGVKDLTRLGLPVAVCLALGAAGVSSYYLADRQLQEAKTQRAAIALQRAEVQGKLDRANEEEREILASLQQYRALEARGITGDENRLDWIDVLATIKSERRLFNISYSIEPQKPLDYPGLAARNGVYFMTSRVRINLQLLHEQDLLDFFDELAKRGKSHLSARSCDIQRMDRGGGGTVLSPRLQADCVVDLITIRHDKPA